MKCISSLAMLALLLVASPVQADEPDEAYLPIYSQIQDAESLEASGQTTQALAQYRKVFPALKAFQQSHPNWNAKVVAQRLGRLTEKIDTLSRHAPAATQAGTNAAGASATSAAPSATADGAVKLLQAGAEPRKALRLHPKAGDKQTVEMTLKVSTATKMGAMETPPIKMPAMKLTFEATVKSVSPKGDITYEMVIQDAGVAEESGAASQMVEMTKALISGAKGATVTSTVSDRGINKSTAVKLASGADPQSRQTMDQLKGLVVTFPEEAVGPGAKWEARKVSKTQGFPVTLTETYELVAAEGDRLTLKTSTTENAANQKIQNPMGGGVAKMDLIKYAATVTGDLTADLGQLMPAEATAKQHVDTTMAMGSGAQKQTVGQKMDVEVRLQSK
jgi:hypothetical protein